METKKSCKVTIFGDEYTLVSDESSEHVARVAQMVDSIMKVIAEKAATLPEKKVAVLAAVQIASKVVVLENEKKCDRQKELAIIEQIDKALFSA